MPASCTAASSPRLVSDSVAALTALNSDSRLPDNGVVALVDFGGSGTSITLADAASDFTPITDTVRYPEFSGDVVDQALMIHVLDNVGHGNGGDPASTGVVAHFAGLREECRLAKERLSKEAVTELVVELPGQRSRVEVSRAELDSLIEDRLSGLLSVFDEMLRSNRIRVKDIAAVAMAGGGAKIPIVAQRLSSHTKASVVTAVQPGFAMAVGAVMLAAERSGRAARRCGRSSDDGHLGRCVHRQFRRVERHLRRPDRCARYPYRHVRRIDRHVHRPG